MSVVFFTWCLFFQTNLYSILSIVVIMSLQTKIKLHTYVINGRTFAFKTIIFPFIVKFLCDHMLRRIFNLSMPSSKIDSSNFISVFSSLNSKSFCGPINNFDITDFTNSMVST